MPEKMTATEAKSFSNFSATNAALIYAALDCSCEPYEDVFTYRRWKALGFQVQRGEKKRVSVLTFHQVEDDDGSTRLRPWNSHLFCRCQVQPKENTDG